LANYPKSALRSLKSILARLFFNPRHFFDSYFFSVNAFHVFFMNLRYPHRTLARIRFRQLYFPEIIQRQRYTDPDRSDYTFSRNVVVENPDVICLALKKYGFCTLEEYFSPSELLAFRNTYSCFFNEKPPRDQYLETNAFHFSNNLSRMWFDPCIMTALKSLFRTPPLASVFPYLAFTYPSHNSTLNSRDPTPPGFAEPWHLDQPNEICAHVLFTDVSEETSHTRVIPSSHLRLGVPNGYMSKEYVRAKGFKEHSLEGAAGSVTIFSGSTIHRMHAVKDSLRMYAKFVFSPGTNLYYDPEQILRLFSGEFKYENLSSTEKSYLRGLIPPAIPYGIEAKDSWFVRSNFPRYK